MRKSFWEPCRVGLLCRDSSDHVENNHHHNNQANVAKTELLSNNNILLSRKGLMQKIRSMQVVCLNS